MEYEYPYEDKFGNYRFATVGGKRMKIYEKLGLTKSMNKNGSFIKNLKNKLESEEYVKIAKKIVSEKKTLKCCEEVSDAIVTKLNEENIEAEVVEVKTFHKEHLGKKHFVIKYKDILYDYTWKQFDNSNSENDVSLKMYYQLKSDSKLYSDNKEIKIKSQEEVFSHFENGDNKDFILFEENKNYEHQIK